MRGESLCTSGKPPISKYFENALRIRPAVTDENGATGIFAKTPLKSKNSENESGNTSISNERPRISVAISLERSFDDEPVRQSCTRELSNNRRAYFSHPSIFCNSSRKYQHCLDAASGNISACTSPIKCKSSTLSPRKRSSSKLICTIRSSSIPSSSNS